MCAKAVYVALTLTLSGEKEVLGLWVEQTEGARFWLGVLNELKARGVEDILIAVVDGLKGFPAAIEAMFPQTMTQTCIVHLIRNPLETVSWKDRKAVMPSLTAIYQAPTAEAAEAALKLLYLAIQHAGGRWKPAIVWPEAKLQFIILFGNRIARLTS